MYLFLTVLGALVVNAKVQFQPYVAFSLENGNLTRLEVEVEHIASKFNTTLDEVLTRRWDTDYFNGIAVNVPAAMGRHMTDQLGGFAIVHPNEPEYIEQTITTKITTRTNPIVWNLRRISSRKDEPNSSIYSYPADAGVNVDLYIIDSGINQHVEFEDRLVQGVNLVAGEPMSDLNGHGTSCGSIAAGKLVGVANKAKVISVKVANEIGATDGATQVTGLVWAVQQATKDKNFDLQKRDGAKRIPIISMSISARSPVAQHALAAISLKHKVPIFVSAGNTNMNDCKVRQNAFVVGGTMMQDMFWKQGKYGSNWGRCVALNAPSKDIRNANYDSKDKYQEGDGTSFATPQVAGIAALLMSENPMGYPRGDLDIYSKLQGVATKDAIKDIMPGTKNLLAYNKPL